MTYTLSGLKYMVSGSKNVNVLQQGIEDAIKLIEEVYKEKQELFDIVHKLFDSKETPTKIKDRIMILKGGSPALHKLGNIGRDFDDIIWVSEETENFYIGSFKEGFGFIGVKFLKEHVRPLTKAEIDELNQKYFSINGQVLGKNNYDYDGYSIPLTPEEQAERLEKFYGKVAEKQ